MVNFLAEDNGGQVIMKRILCFAFIGIFLASCVSIAGKSEEVCAKKRIYKEGKTYTLTGTIERTDFVHPTERHYTVYLLKLDKPFWINGDQTGMVHAEKVQLALMYSGDNKKNKLYKLRNKHVKVRGKVYGSCTAWYAVPIYVNKAKVKSGK